MMTNEQIEQEILALQQRNRRVEADKAWETSASRKVLIVLLTYLVIVVFFVVARLPDPFINAIVPSLAFVLSTLSVPVCKGWWKKHVYKK